MLSQAIDTILISHSHIDRFYARELVNIIKVTEVEKKGVKIICSSYEGYSIPADISIYDYLREKLKGNVWVIYVLSPYYYESAACLNEMGATWVQNKKYSTFLVPYFKFGEIKGAINPTKNAFSLNQKSKLKDFKNIIIDEFKLEKINDNIWESVRDESLKKIDALSKQEIKKLRKEKVEFETAKNMENGSLEIVLRDINQNDFPMNFTFVKGSLKDINGNIYEFEKEITKTCIYNGENKLIFISGFLGESDYSAAKHDICDIKLFNFMKFY